MQSDREIGSVALRFTFVTRSKKMLSGVWDWRGLVELAVPFTEGKTAGFRSRFCYHFTVVVLDGWQSNTRLLYPCPVSVPYVALGPYCSQRNLHLLYFPPCNTAARHAGELLDPLELRVRNKTSTAESLDFDLDLWETWLRMCSFLINQLSYTLYYTNRFLTKKKIVYSFVESVLLISVLYRSASGYFLSSSRKMQFW